MQTLIETHIEILVDRCICGDHISSHESGHGRCRFCAVGCQQYVRDGMPPRPVLRPGPDC